MQALFLLSEYRTPTIADKQGSEFNMRSGGGAGPGAHGRPRTPPCGHPIFQTSFFHR